MRFHYPDWTVKILKTAHRVNEGEEFQVFHLLATRFVQDARGSLFWSLRE